MKQEEIEKLNDEERMLGREVRILELKKKKIQLEKHIKDGVSK